MQKGGKKVHHHPGYPGQKKEPKYPSLEDRVYLAFDGWRANMPGMQSLPVLLVFLGLLQTTFLQFLSCFFSLLSLLSSLFSPPSTTLTTITLSFTTQLHSISLYFFSLSSEHKTLNTKTTKYEVHKKATPSMA